MQVKKRAANPHNTCKLRNALHVFFEVAARWALSATVRKSTWRFYLTTHISLRRRKTIWIKINIRPIVCSTSTHNDITYTYAWNTLRNFCPDFPPILQSEQVGASWGKSEPVRFHRKSCIVLWSDFDFWFYPVGGYQTCLIFSADFRTHFFHLLCVS